VAWSEDRLHRWLAQQEPPRILRGSSGHDASVLTRPAGMEVLCTDQVLLGVHCDLDAPARSIGRKAAARALSDLAATAATPRALTLSVRAPACTRESSIKAWIRGVMQEAELAGAALCGGDLACGDGPASLSVTAVGEYPGRGRPPGRDRAKPGDYIVLTGPVGGSRLGRHLRITPRFEASRKLHFGHGARSMMDVSDGLAWDLYRLCRASGVQGTLDTVPIHRDAHRAARSSGRPPLWHALHDGEDHELIATLSARGHKALMAESRPVAVVIGKVREGEGLLLSGGLTEEPPRLWDPKEGGWRHG